MFGFNIFQSHFDIAIVLFYTIFFVFLAMMMSGGLYNDEDMSGGQPNNFGCYEDAARSVEIVREENKDGQLGSFGFAIFREKPPRIGTVIPGG